MLHGLCPECRGTVESDARICEDHDSEGVCDACGSRFAGLVTVRCQTCRTNRTGLLALAGLIDSRVRAYFRDHGYELLAPSWEGAQAFLGATERLHAVDPVDYEARWTLDEETLSVRFDATATVTDVDRH